MRVLIDIVGILLIIFGIASFGYQGFTYTKQEKVAEIGTQIGSFKLTAGMKKKVEIPPAVSGLAMLAGIVLVVANRVGRSR